VREAGGGGTWIVDNERDCERRGNREAMAHGFGPLVGAYTETTVPHISDFV